MSSILLLPGFIFLFFTSHVFSSSDCSPFSLKSIEIIVPTNQSYDDVRHQWAWNFGTVDDRNEILAPDIIAKPTSESEIKDILEYANSCGYTMVVRSGGHQYTGLSSCDISLGNCLQMDMKNFNKFEVNYDSNDKPVSVTLGVGLTLDEAAELAMDHSFAFVHGTVKTICIGGHFQTSGQGHLSKSFGNGLSHVKSFRIILADGSVETVTPSNNPELFFAVIGGNAGSWGVVLEYEINVLLDSDYKHNLYIQFEFVYTKDNFYEIIGDLIDIMNDDLYKNTNDIEFIVTLKSDIFEGIDLILVMFTWTGKDNGNIHDTEIYDQIILPFKKKNSFKAEQQFGYNNGYPLSKMSYQILASNELLMGNDEYKFYTMDNYGQYVMDSAFLDNIIDRVDSVMNNKYLHMVWSIYMSQGNPNMNYVYNNGNGFPFKDMKFGVEIFMLFNNDTYSQLAKDELLGLREDNEDFWNKQGYSNVGMRLLSSTFPDNFDPSYSNFNINKDWIYYYPNVTFYKKLITIKQKYDPNNLFKNKLTIPLEYEENDSVKRVQNKHNSMRNEGTEFNSKLFLVTVSVCIALVIILVNKYGLTIENKSYIYY